MELVVVVREELEREGDICNISHKEDMDTHLLLIHIHNIPNNSNLNNSGGLRHMVGVGTLLYLHRQRRQEVVCGDLDMVMDTDIRIRIHMGIMDTPLLDLVGCSHSKIRIIRLRLRQLLRVLDPVKMEGMEVEGEGHLYLVSRAKEGVMVVLVVVITEVEMEMVVQVVMGDLTGYSLRR